MNTHIIHKLGDNIDTDQIIASQYLMLPDIESMKPYAFETINPEFTEKFNYGDCIVAGKNFGCGSSREQAPAVLKAMGASAVIAESFARIFFRNSINIGLVLIQCRQIYNDVEDNSEISFDMKKSTVYSNGKTYAFSSYPQYVSEIISTGGLIESINRRLKETEK